MTCRKSLEFLSAFSSIFGCLARPDGLIAWPNSQWFGSRVPRILENVGERVRAVHLISRACSARRLALSGEIIDSDRGRRRRPRRHLFVLLCVCTCEFLGRFLQRAASSPNQDVAERAKEPCAVTSAPRAPHK